MVTGSRPRVGAWTGRLVGVAFTLMGLAVIYRGLILWMASHELGGIDLMGVLMMGIGLGLIGLRETARKVAIVIGLFYVVCSAVPLWSVFVGRQDGPAAVGVLATAMVMAVASVALLLPATREAFRKDRTGLADDEQPLLNTAR